MCPAKQLIFPKTKDTHESYLQEPLSADLFINFGYNQWASRIVTLIILPKSVNNESASLVQQGYTHTELSS